MPKESKRGFREPCYLIPQIQWSPYGFWALKHAVNDFSAKDCQLKGCKFTLYCVSFRRIAFWPSHIWPHRSEPCWKRKISCTIDRDLKHWTIEGSRYRIPLLKYHTLPETNSSPLKIGHPKRKRSYSKHPFSGAKMLVSGRVIWIKNTTYRFIQGKSFIKPNWVTIWPGSKIWVPGFGTTTI